MSSSTLPQGSVQSKVVAVLGYGNQGRAQALNLRDSGVRVQVGARNGPGQEQALQDGFEVSSYLEAATRSDVLMFLLPDTVIPEIYRNLLPLLSSRSFFVGFAHGFAYHYRLFDRLPSLNYFLVAPKGAGAVLRRSFELGKGLPMGLALGQVAVDAKEETVRSLCLSYAKAIGAYGALRWTSFREETECDLFGEQVVLCGGLMELLEMAQTVLVEGGHSQEMAFYECCYEAKRILDLLLAYGPLEFSKKISPTAFYGGATRGPRVFPETGRKVLENILTEIQSGEFAREWVDKIRAGEIEVLEKARLRWATSNLQKAFQSVQSELENE